MNSHGLTNRIEDYNEHSPYFADFYQFFNKLVHSDNGNAGRNGRSCKVIIVTSAVEKEGKTTLASYASITGALATQDFHLLIDADLRRPSLHKRFGVRLESGLSEALMNGDNLPYVIRKTPYGALHMITAGKIVTNPFQLLDVDKMNKFFENLGNYYKMIIVDSAPIIPVSDALKLAQIADGVVLVVKAGKTPKEVVRRAVDVLKQSDCRLLGVVLNDIGEVLPYYYRRKYYQYNYQLSEALTG